MYIDGVSVYELNDQGKIRKHRLENIVLRNSGKEVEARQVSLDFAWPRAGLATPELAMPFFRTLHAALPDDSTSTQRSQPTSSQPLMSLMSASRRAPAPQASAEGETPMERAARERDEMERERVRLAELRAPKQSQQQSSGEFGFGWLKDSVQPCETSYDCDAVSVPHLTTPPNRQVEALHILWVRQRLPGSSAFYCLFAPPIAPC